MCYTLCTVKCTSVEDTAHHGPMSRAAFFLLPFTTCSLSTAAMRHVQRRLASTAARALTVAPSQLPRFPPKDAIFENRAVPKPPFQPETWAAAQPPPRTALSAFAHRVGLGNVLTTPELVQQACTHASFVGLQKEVNPNAPAPATNAQLEQVGNALMGLFASEYLAAKYPYLPTKVLKAAVTAHVGPLTCANVAQEMGATQLLRWNRTIVRAQQSFSTIYSPSCSPGTPPIRRSCCIPTPSPPSRAPLPHSSTKSAPSQPPGSSCTPSFFPAR